MGAKHSGDSQAWAQVPRLYHFAHMRLKRLARYKWTPKVQNIVQRLQEVRAHEKTISLLLHNILSRSRKAYGDYIGSLIR